MGTNTYNYAYDPIGNRLSEVRDLMSEVSTNLYTANTLNQYSVISNFSSQVSSLIPQYDADGNMLTYNGWTFTWNGENRLIAASNATTVISNTYDYMGRRIQKVVAGVGDPGSTVTNTFLYDGWALIRETVAGVGDPGSTNSYVYGIDLSGSMQGAGTIGGILSADLNGTTAFYCYDANGNVTDLINTNGAIVAHYEYDAFGNETLRSGSVASNNPFRFSTKYLDETGLYYYGLRYYSPELGRWVSRDPVGERGGKHLYRFVANRSVNAFDLLGLWTRTGVLDVLCQSEEGRAVVRDILSQYNIYSYQSYTFTRQKYTDATLTTPDGAATTKSARGYHRKSAREIGVDIALSDGEAASTFLHEGIHGRQYFNYLAAKAADPSATQLSTAEREYEAHILQEKFKIAQGLPPKDPSFRVQDPATGEWSADEDAIKAWVDVAYAIGVHAVDSAPTITDKQGPQDAWECPCDIDALLDLSALLSSASDIDVTISFDFW